VCLSALAWLTIDASHEQVALSKRVQILGLLVEGNSLWAASRLADVSSNTVTELLVDVGAACTEYRDRALRELSYKRLQLDEIWALAGAKE